ncbi:MAG: substrate-binding periplasmic protein [Bacillota bacterium]
MISKTIPMLLVLIFCCAFTAKKTVRIATLDWVPFISPNLPNNGWVAQVAEAAFAEGNIKVEWLFYPWPRALTAAELGKVDAVYPTFYSDERATKFNFSDSYRGGLSVIVALKSSGINFKTSLRELSPYTIGVVRGYVFGKEFDEAKYLKKVDSDEDEQNIRKLIHKRVDLIIINLFVLQNLIKTQYADEPKVKDIRVIGPPVQTEYFRMAFTKKRDTDDLRKAYNSGLSKIKRSKKFDHIMTSGKLEIPKEYRKWFE